MKARLTLLSAGVAVRPVGADGTVTLLPVPLLDVLSLPPPPQAVSINRPKKRN